jgi:hypothetical protein
MTLAVLPSDPTERRLLPILLMMFVAGLVLACTEVVNWWKARMTQFPPPPLAKLITYVREADGHWHTTHVLWFPVQHPHALPEPLKPPVQGVQEDRLKKAA